MTGGAVAVWQATIFAQMDNDLGRPDSARRDMEDTLAQMVNLGQIQTLVPCLEQLARADATLGLVNEAAQAIQQYLDALDRNPFLHWECTMPILFACRWYARRGTPEASEAARACLRRLERAHAQMRSPRTAAALAEARAIVAAASDDVAQAVTDYRRAIAAWEGLGHHYDCARALNDLSRVLIGAGEIKDARAAIESARHMTDALAAQLVNKELRQSFGNSQLVQALRNSHAALVNVL